MIRFSRQAFIVASTLLPLAPAMAGDMMTLVQDGLSKGHGAMCSLEMQPVAQNGYYPCLDIGPYRFVAEYGRTRAFVVTPGQPPFEILVSDGAGTRFSYKGPWETDLANQVASWHAYEIGGGRTQQSVAADEAARVGAARDSVTAYLESQKPKPVEDPAAPQSAQQAPVQPQIYYIVPPAFTPQATTATPPANGQIPLTGVQTIDGIQRPGTLVAPGVVAYPAQ